MYWPALRFHDQSCDMPVSTIFSHRDPNPYLTQVVDSGDLFERTRELIDRAAGFVVVDGRAGTLSELSFLWALERAGSLGTLPVVVLGDYWRPLIRVAEEQDYLEAAQLAATTIVATEAEAVERLSEALWDDAHGRDEREH